MKLSFKTTQHSK